jgi:hypothetical protein
MLDLTSDSYVFIYTKEGVFSVPALEVKLAGTSGISTQVFILQKVWNIL